MRILVTGGCGFIGSAFVRFAIGRMGAEIVNLDKLTYAASPEAVGPFADDPRYSFRQVDIRDDAGVRAAFEEARPDAVLHLAAESHVDRSIDSPGEVIATNVVGTFTMLQAARRHFETLSDERRAAFRFHYVSTDEVFGTLASADPPVDEAAPYRPSSPYSASKAASDHLVRAWGTTYRLPVTWSNACNNYGPWQYPEKLVPLMVGNALDGRHLPLYGDGGNRRNWLHVEDHAAALWTILRRGAPGRQYNVSGNEERSNVDVVQRICAIMDRRFPDRAPHRSLIRFVLDRPGHDFRYAVDASRLARELGFAPRHSFETGLEETVDWYLDHQDWWRGRLAHEGAPQVSARS